MSAAPVVLVPTPSRVANGVRTVEALPEQEWIDAEYVPLVDDAPVLKAVRELVRVSERVRYARTTTPSTVSIRGA